MKVSFWSESVALNGKDIYKAFEYSIQKTDTVVYNDMSADTAVIWSTLWQGRMKPNQAVFDHYRSQGKPVIIMEVGVLNRNNSFRIAVNHINNTGYYGHLDNPVQPDRQKRFNITLKPIRQQGNNVVICCQNESSQLWTNMPPTTAWLSDIVPKLSNAFPDKNILIRPHPRVSLHRSIHEKYNIEVCEKRGTKDDTNFVEILDDAYCVVSPTGGSAIEAVINGVTAIVSPESLAAPVASTDYKTFTPSEMSRLDWLSRVKNTEWFIDEVELGIPWHRIRPYVLNQISNH
jgi:hypothetical protein